MMMMNGTSWQMLVFLSYVNPTCSASPYECPDEKRIYLINKCEREISRCTNLQKKLKRKHSELMFYRKLEMRGSMFDKDRRGGGVPAKKQEEHVYEVNTLMLKVELSKARMDKLKNEINKSGCTEI